LRSGGIERPTPCKVNTIKVGRPVGATSPALPETGVDSRAAPWQRRANSQNTPEDVMATKAVRGTKRTCQSSDCGARFYDLNRNPIVCPVCATTYVIATGMPAAAAAEKVRKPVVKEPEFEIADGVKPEVPEGEEALAEIEEAGEAVAVEDDETFLEEEEGGNDVSGIVSGPEGEEEQ
jgi:uncharacterized protein (TIGR02300 family)